VRAIITRGSATMDNERSAEEQPSEVGAGEVAG
jgi:hypothetical protein